MTKSLEALLHLSLSSRKPPRQRCGQRSCTGKAGRPRHRTGTQAAFLTGGVGICIVRSNQITYWPLRTRNVCNAAGT